MMTKLLAIPKCVICLKVAPFFWWSLLLVLNFLLLSMFLAVLIGAYTEFLTLHEKIDQAYRGRIQPRVLVSFLLPFAYYEFVPFEEEILQALFEEGEIFVAMLSLSHERNSMLRLTVDNCS